MESWQLGLLMAQVMRARHNRLVQLLGGLGIHPAQAQLLYVLLHSEGITQKQLGDEIDRKPATVTMMLSRLESAGFVERRRDGNDQRIFRVYITEKGRSVQKATEMAIRQMQQEAYGNFSDEELETMHGFIVAAKENLEAAIENDSRKMKH